MQIHSYAFLLLTLLSVVRTQAGNIRGKVCDYDKEAYWLIPGSADNSTCTRPEVLANGVHLRILSDTVKITPEVIRLPGCFYLNFDMLVEDSINRIPRSFLAKNEFQLYEIPDVEQMQCQNASNNGCGGYGNNCYQCDFCKELEQLDSRNPPDTGNRAVNKLLRQFNDVRCADTPGRYRVKRQLCFNDWSVLDANNDCKIDFVEKLVENSDADADILKDAYEALQQKGHSTLISRFYLAHNATTLQNVKRLSKQKLIAQHVARNLTEARRNWKGTASAFQKFQDWQTKNAVDKWHKEQYLPYLIRKNEIACLKVTFTVCNKKPVKNKSAGPAAWWRRIQQPKFSCPKP